MGTWPNPKTSGAGTRNVFNNHNTSVGGNECDSYGDVEHIQCDIV